MYISYHYVHQRLAYLLYKAADEYGWMDPEVVEEVLEISRQEAEECSTTENPSQPGASKEMYCDIWLCKDYTKMTREICHVHGKIDCILLCALNWLCG